MSAITIFGACVVTIMMVSYALESRSRWWILVFAVACVGSSSYGWIVGAWPFGVVEAVWAGVALRRWYGRT